MCVAGDIHYQIMTKKNVHLGARLACYCRYEQHKYKYMCVGAVLYKAQRLECKADPIRL